MVDRLKGIRLRAEAVRKRRGCSIIKLGGSLEELSELQAAVRGG